MKILAVIPARGGSKGIPRKNIKLLNGKPLISYVIDTLKQSSYEIDIVVSSDSDEILSISKRYGVEISKRPKELSEDAITLDPVIHYATEQREVEQNTKYDYVITIQPTSPLLTVKTLDSALESMLNSDIDTIISAVNNPKLSWKEEDGRVVPNYSKRVNRQYMDKCYVETGAFVITRRMCVKKDTRFGEKISIYEVPKNESLDIDHIEDWWLAEKLLSKKTILIRVDGYKEIGMGHIYRGLQLIEELTDSDVFFVLSSKSDLGIEKIDNNFYPYEIIENDLEILNIIQEKDVDIVINDILDTSEEYMKSLLATGVRVINFEDVGKGARLAHAVINDLYEPINDYKNFYWGSDYYLLRNEFIIEQPNDWHDEVKEVVVAFGGSDPANNTKKSVQALVNVLDYLDFHCTVILGMGYEKKEEIEQCIVGKEKYFEIVQDVKIMTEYMKGANLAICSQGRTMLELASMAVPTILISEHEREAKHEFGTLKNGFLNLGIGKQLKIDTLVQTLKWVIECTQVRKSMYDEMKKNDLRHGFKRVQEIIFGII